MNKEFIIIIAEDDEGHAILIRKNLQRAGISNSIIHFKDGQQIIDFFFKKRKNSFCNKNRSYLLLLDIQLPKVNGRDILRRLKQDNELRKMPVIIITTTDDPEEIRKCYKMGCSYYVTKPIDYQKFIKAIKQLGSFFRLVEHPKTNYSTG